MACHDWQLNPVCDWLTAGKQRLWFHNPNGYLAAPDSMQRQKHKMVSNVPGEFFGFIFCDRIVGGNGEVLFFLHCWFSTMRKPREIPCLEGSFVVRILLIFTRQRVKEEVWVCD